MSERRHCERKEKWGDEWKPCGLRAEFYNETFGYLCGDHGMLALIAGIEIEKARERARADRQQEGDG